jgi:response regulator RpfG family c-di-GMP phosphodiesterase
LLSSPNHNWGEEVISTLSKNNFEVTQAFTGKLCQKKIYIENDYDICIIDSATAGHSAFEVLRYIKLNYSSINVILVFQTKEVRKNLELSNDDLKRLGCSDILTMPFTSTSIIDCINGITQHTGWRDVINRDTSSSSVEKEFREADNKFSVLPIKDIYMGNKNIFDLYLRVSKNKYLKVLHRGDSFEVEQLADLKNKKGIDKLYFRNTEKLMYINFINSVVNCSLKKASVSINKKNNMIQTGTQMIYEEVLCKGLDPQIVLEINSSCENMFSMIKRDEQVSSCLKNYLSLEKELHVFNVSFLSLLLARHLLWVSPRVVRVVGMSALLHDIGKIKVNPQILEKNKCDFSVAERNEYEMHPVFGAELLQTSRLIDEPIRQVVYQHHESVNAQGFPNNLPGVRIYPIAKVVALANHFSHCIINAGGDTTKALTDFVTDPEDIIRFDADLVRCLIKIFIKNSKKGKR